MATLEPAEIGESVADRRAARVVALASFLWLALVVPFGVPFSAGVAGALKILDGGWPYRDFWTIYAPGHFALLAGLFAIFGRQLLVAALAAVVLEAVACRLFFTLVRRVEVERRVALAAALAFAVVLSKAAPTLTTYQPLLVCGLAGFDRAIAAARSRSRRDAFVAGLWLGAAAWFKHDVAAYLLVAAFALLVGAMVLRPARGALPIAVPFVAGAAATLLPVALLVCATAGRDAWQDLVVFPLGDFPASRPEKYPLLRDAWSAASGVRGRGSALLQWLRHWAPVWCWLVLLAAAWRGRARMATTRLAAAIASLLLLPLFFAAAHVQINTHILSMSALTLGLLAVAWSDLAAAPRRRATKALLAGATLLYGIALADEPSRQLARALDVALHGRTFEASGAAGVMASADEADEIEGAARLVRALTGPDEPIHVAVTRHDAVVVSRPELYLLLGRRAATRYAELHPGIVDREPAQREIIDELAPVRVIVRWRFGWRKERLDEIRAKRQLALPGTGATLLDDWIDAHYEAAGRSGELEVLVRRADAK